MTLSVNMIMHSAFMADLHISYQTIWTKVLGTPARPTHILFSLKFKDKNIQQFSMKGTRSHREAGDGSRCRKGFSPKP